jgi:glycosyltransferase involved in cell wall biosynthesis
VGEEIMDGILHIDSERGWRGGQQQAVYLFKQLLKDGYKTHFLCKKGSELEKRFTDQNLPHHTDSLIGEIDIFSAYRTAKFCKKNGFRIVHLHSGHALAIGILAKLFYRDLILIGARRVDFSVNKNFISHYKYTNRYVDKIVAISENIKRVLVNDGVSESNIEVIRSGVDIHKFDHIGSDLQLKKEFQLDNDSLIVGTVAALVGHKDYPNLLRAAKIVLDKDPKIVFIAAGDGKNREEIHKLKEELDLGDRFKFLGYREDIGELLKIMDIFVLGSKKEGLGTSTLDAMSVGLPVIGTDAGGIPEVIDHGYNGLIVPKQNHHQLSKGIIDLVDDPDKRKQFGENSLKRVKGFSFEEMVKQNKQLYKKLL